MGNIVQLNGEAHPSKDEPNQSVITHLEKALERAKSGEVHGVVLIETYHDFATSYLTAGYVTGYSTIGATQVALNNIMNCDIDG